MVTYGLSCPPVITDIEGDGSQHRDEASVEQAHQAAEEHQGLKGEEKFF